MSDAYNINTKSEDWMVKSTMAVVYVMIKAINHKFQTKNMLFIIRTWPISKVDFGIT